MKTDTHNRTHDRGGVQNETDLLPTESANTKPRLLFHSHNWAFISNLAAIADIEKGNLDRQIGNPVDITSGAWGWRRCQGRVGAYAERRG